MKKLIILLSLFLSTVVFSVEPKFNDNFKQTKKEFNTSSPGKIEVLELFWYGCIHCYSMDPYLNKWANTLPDDVVFKRVPAIPRKSWVPGAKAYYALETLGLEGKLHEKLFDAIHKNKELDPNNENAIINWITLNGKLDAKEVKSAFNSFSIDSKLKKSYKIFKDAGATGVPTIIIDGNYMTSSTMAGGEQNAIDITNYIIKNIRNDRKKSK
ncbi:MAG: thiol:disulfide interchange protein DsbA/DsbL [Nitrosomonadales bacterium]|jgi:thiol:disulfide interchange protein DsbA|nr:thiol:disulfide interchange protein DsbA/DsbL [Nitrosomonadales bacterium]MBT4182897.1 thiol:disulfide interchange protein DsbA/DsbL [Nitrosomonadales bacterium]MBT4571231.1 thiol:disulfide interchange protein DsbA/DsbL [Nitrosomonadales bacterium]MBT5150512.1 thiol:disulfide interchange protein DsbA/DsbL [Nitrosomonadales bacterium]MBT5573676.1 thiol:disulfide interchange protein DsbA/DsbL [Nitrosomonadales bacterium]